MATDDDDDGGSTSPRSPRYPALSLREAVAKVSAIYDKDKMAGSPVLSALKHMGYKGSSGPANASLAALRRFGLIENNGSRVVPTSRAIAILRLPESDPRRQEALRDAMRGPSLYRNLLNSYAETGLPSQETLEQELFMDKRFNHNRVPGLVKDFLESVKFAGLVDADGVLLTQDTKGKDEARHEQEEESGGMDGKHKNENSAGFSSPKPPHGTRDFPLYTSKAKGALFVPDQMSQRDFELLELQIQNSLAVIRATAVVNE